MQVPQLLAAHSLLTIPTTSVVVAVVVPLLSSLLISVGLAEPALTAGVVVEEEQPVLLLAPVPQPQPPSSVVRVATGSSSLLLGNSLGSANAPCLSL